LYVNTDVLLLNLRELSKDLNLSKFLKLYQKKQYDAWDQDVINYCFRDKINRVDYYLYNYFPNLGLNNIDDNKFLKNVKIIHFAGGPKPWNVPRYKISEYSVISEWWNVANEVGISRNLTREIKDIIKILIFFFKKSQKK
jgi:lipopolysaccharide biosynthesis glycosyltransferase